MNMHFWTFRLQSPHVPPHRHCFSLRAGLATDSLGSRCRRFFGLRSLLAVSSVTSGRIEFVSRLSIEPQFYGLSVHFQLLSTSPHSDAVTFSCWRLAPPE